VDGGKKSRRRKRRRRRDKDYQKIRLVVYTSTLPRAVQTIETKDDEGMSLKQKAIVCEHLSSLNFLDVGAYKQLPYSELRSNSDCLKEISKWSEDKYRFRFPGGESQLDLARSLEPLVFELEREVRPVLVVSHLSTLQVLYGYFLGGSISNKEYSTLDIPPHTVIELIPSSYGWIETRYKLDNDNGPGKKACTEYTVLRNSKFY